MPEDPSPRWTPFVLVALMLAAGATGATMASPLFPLYQAAWGIAPSTVTALYVAYMLGVLAALLFLTRLTEHVGAVQMLRIGAGLMVAGLLMSTLAPGPLTLTPVRVLIGGASGIITSAATLALFELSPRQGGLPAIVASSTTMAGFSLGPILCGLVAQFAPFPLVTPYLAVAAVIFVLLICLLRLQNPPPAPPGEAAPQDGAVRSAQRVTHTRSNPTRPSMAPHLGLPGAGALPAFSLTAFTAFAAYALFSLLAALAPSFLSTILPWHGPAISGLTVGLVLSCSALAQLPARHLGPRQSLRLSLWLMGAGALALGLAVHKGLAALFLLAELAIGCGHGIAFLSGMTFIGLVAPGPQRGPVLSSHLCLAYLGTIVPILCVGWMADGMGLVPAVTLFCAVFALICFTLLGASRLVRWPDPGAPQ